LLHETIFYSHNFVHYHLGSCTLPTEASAVVSTPRRLRANAETAVKIAEAVLIPVYGEKEIISERPFKAVLADNIWRVSGTFHCDAARCFGGVAEVNISKKSGQILRMIHGM
jgi:hypothetical protein